jgi:hypothetical protein
VVNDHVTTVPMGEGSNTFQNYVTSLKNGPFVEIIEEKKKKRQVLRGSSCILTLV